MTNTALEIVLDILGRLTLVERQKDIIEKEMDFIEKYGIDKLPYYSINTNSQPLPKETERYANIFERKLDGMVIIRLWLIRKVLDDLNYKMP